MPLPNNPIMFANNPLDRAGNLRRDPEWVKARLADETALFVPMWQLNPLVLPEMAEGDGRDVGWLPRAALADAVDEQTLMVFLGINRRGKPLFAVDISRLSNPEDDGPFRGMGVFEDLRALASAGDMPVRSWRYWHKPRECLIGTCATAFVASAAAPPAWPKLAISGFATIAGPSIFRAPTR